MKTTVIMATYNGEKYIEDQLESIIKQTVRPDEIIILDDCSTDGTVDIIQRIAAKHPETTIEVVINDYNKGWRKNFIDGFFRSKEDVIFCADQDDIWNPRKIEIMTGILSDNENIDVLASNLIPKYEEGATKLGRFYIERYGKQDLSKVPIQDHGMMMIRPGCTLCFRRKLLKQIEKVWTPRLAHDEVVWGIGLASDSLYIINEPLIYFRRHGSNNSPSNKKRVETRLDRAECEYEKVNNILMNAGLIGISADTSHYLWRIKSLEAARIDMFRKRSLFSGVKLLRNVCIYSQPRQWLVDMLCLMKG